MKYLDLLTELQNLTEEQLLQDVIVYNNTFKSYSASSNIFLANETDPIALNQPFLTV